MEKVKIGIGSQGKVVPRSSGQEVMAEVMTSGRRSALRPLCQKQYNNQPLGSRLYYEQSTYPAQRLGKDDEKTEMASFSFSSFDAVTTATETKTASVENPGAPAKDSFGEEAADRTAGSTSFLTPLPRRTEEVAPPHQHHSINF